MGSKNVGLVRFESVSSGKKRNTSDLTKKGKTHSFTRSPTQPRAALNKRGHATKGLENTWASLDFGGGGGGAGGAGYRCVAVEVEGDGEINRRRRVEMGGMRLFVTRKRLAVNLREEVKNLLANILE